MIPMDPALERLVTNRPLDERWNAACACPKCGSGDVQMGEHEYTLVGWRGGDAEDPNHHWQRAACRACGLGFCRQYVPAKDAVWYTDLRNTLLKGVHACFEGAVYQCAACGGEVTRFHMDLQAKGPVHSLSVILQGPNKGPQFRTFYRCAGCKAQAEVEANA